MKVECLWRMAMVHMAKANVKIEVLMVVFISRSYPRHNKLLPVIDLEGATGQYIAMTISQCAVFCHLKALKCIVWHFISNWMWQFSRTKNAKALKKLECMFLHTAVFAFHV